MAALVAVVYEIIVFHHAVVVANQDVIGDETHDHHRDDATEDVLDPVQEQDEDTLDQNHANQVDRFDVVTHLRHLLRLQHQ